MNYTIVRTIALLSVAGILGITSSPSATVFIIQDPPVDFEVIDMAPFDGNGDTGPFDTFSDVLLGTEGEIRSMAEFNISPFSVPPGEIITSATLQVRITAIHIYGLGVNGEPLTSVILDGYIGDGVAQLSDFQAGDGNFLDMIDTPNPQIGQVLTFDVTEFVTELVDAHETYVGLTARPGSFGGLWVSEGSGYPMLTIETGPGTDVSTDGDQLATLRLYGCTPNPFTSTTSIEYSIPAGSEGPVALIICDAAGRMVQSIQGLCTGPGIQTISWDGRDASGATLPGGVYFYRLSSGGTTETKQVLLVK